MNETRSKPAKRKPAKRKPAKRKPAKAKAARPKSANPKAAKAAPAKPRAAIRNTATRATTTLETATRKPAAPRDLAAYAGKRDFARTPEPIPAPGAAAAGAFVVQKHAARRLHYDLRLELDGVLKSWALTRGPSLTVGEKRLAVHTEDHPVEYLGFEGNIPKGEYGGGAMIVWDRGVWHPQGDPHAGLAKGHLAFTLDGARLEGLWHLVRIKPRRGEKTDPWLLIKADDAFARPPGAPEIIDQETTSQLSGRTTQEVAAGAELRADHTARAAAARARKIALPDVGQIAGARKGLLPTFLEPSLASPCDMPPSGANWIHEIKHDGYRVQARIDGGAVRLFTRKGLDWTVRFAGIAQALKRLALGSALIDGELVVEDAGGISNLNLLQADLSAGRRDRFRYFAFDLLYCEGFDLTAATLVDRKALLQRILAAAAPGSPVRFSEHIETDGPTMLAHTCRFGLEGIVSKRKDLPYRPGRGDHWLKAKCRQSQEFVILGYVPSTAARGTIGSLPIGYYADGALVYAGRVGTGWSAALAASLRRDLDAIKAGKPALRGPLPADVAKSIGKSVIWVEPRLVCEVEFHDWTRDGVIRQAAFKGLRDDKPAAEIGLDAPQKRLRADRGVGVALTHPERILWATPGVTKQGLADFYADIADWILPHVAGRVLSLVRCPSGTDATCFFAKHPWAGLRGAVARIAVGEQAPGLAIGDLAGLLELVQAGVVEIHAWGCTTEHLDAPDRLVFDLDPGEDVPWSAVVAAAREVRGRLRTLGLQSFVKTSGGKGLHVVVPVTPAAGWDDAKAFTRSVAAAMAAAQPDRYVDTIAKRARRGHIFIDYLRNDRGSTAVAAYSTRRSPTATVSTPLAWDELSDSLRSDHFTVDNLRHRLAFLGRDPWTDFFKVRQGIPGRP